MPKIDRIIPLLVYEDIAKAHDFLVNAFGFESGGLQRTPEHNLLAPASLPAAGGGLVVHVDDVDTHFERARTLGAHIESEPADQPYGQREYGVRDPGGHRWWFAQLLSPA